MSFSGPLFERADNGPWHSVHRKDGGHYNTFSVKAADAMEALREFFPDGQADEMNFVLFSTSGVHGMYTTIEEVEAAIDLPGDHDDRVDEVTFLIVQPRIVTLRYGNCLPRTPEDFAFLKKLRESSWAAAGQIGRPEDATPREHGDGREGRDGR